MIHDWLSVVAVKCFAEHFIYETLKLQHLTLTSTSSPSVMPPPMLLRRSVLTLSRRAALTPIPRRTFTSAAVRRKEPDPERDIKTDPPAKPHEKVVIPGQTEDMIPFDGM